MLLQSGSRVMFFGDSIVKASDNSKIGYARLVRDWITANHPSLGVTVMSSGVSGDRVKQLQDRFAKHVTPKLPTIVVVSIGVNDAGCNGKTPTPLATYESGLRDVIAKVQAINALPVLATPALIGERIIAGNPLDAQLETYCDKSREIAVDLDVALVDLRAACLAHLAKYNVKDVAEGVLTDDEVHPIAEGHRVWADAMLRVLADRGV